MRSLLPPVQRRRPDQISLFIAALVPAVLPFLVLMTSHPLLAQPAEDAESSQPPGVMCLAFSSDGRLLAAATGEPEDQGELIVWDVQTLERRLFHREPAGIPAVAFSPDGRTIAIGIFDSKAKLLDVESGEVLHTLDDHPDHVRAVTFTPDGRTLVTADYVGTIQLWDVESGRRQKTLEGHSERIFSVTVSPSGEELLSGSRDYTARLWDLKSGQEKQIFEADRFIVRHVSFSPDGQWFVTSRWDGFVRIRDARSGELKRSLRMGGGIDCAQLAPGNHLLAVCSGRDLTIRLFEAALDEPSGELRQRIEKLIDTMDDDDYTVREAAEQKLRDIGAVSDPILREAMESESVEIRIRARRLLRNFREPEPLVVLRGHEEGVTYLCFSPDGRLLASGDRSGTLKLWEVETWQKKATFSRSE